MKPTVLTALLLALPLAAGAQAIRCTDPATGKVLYTDQPCKNGALVVPKRTEEELRQDAQAAQEARERRAGGAGARSPAAGGGADRGGQATGTRFAG